MNEWSCFWNAEKGKIRFEDATTVVTLNADKVRGFLNSLDMPCQTVGQFKNLILPNLTDIPKSYYKVRYKNKAKQ